jgi:hypothetical protein
MHPSVSASVFSAIARQNLLEPARLLDPARCLARFLFVLPFRLCVSLDARFTIFTASPMFYDPIPLTIPILATGYVLAIYFLLRLVQRSRA